MTSLIVVSGIATWDWLRVEAGAAPCQRRRRDQPPPLFTC